MLDRRSALSLTRGLSTGRFRFAGFRCLIGIDRRQLAIDLGEFVFQVLMLIGELFALTIETLPLSPHDIGEPNLTHPAVP